MGKPDAHVGKGLPTYVVVADSAGWALLQGLDLGIVYLTISINAP
jgi:hypothetical protein